MKKFTISLFFFILTCVNYNALCQDKQIEGFFGIKFGTNKQSVIDTMLARGSAIDTSNNHIKPLWSDNITTLYFKNVTYRQKKVSLFFVELVNNKVFGIYFTFLPDQNAEIIDLYNETVNYISEVYGKGDSFKKFNAPFRDGDFQEIIAIRTGNAIYATRWKIGLNRFNVSISHNPVSVLINCSDGALTAEAYAPK